MKGFQVGILIVFGVFVTLGVLIFSGAFDKKGEKAKEEQAAAAPSITIWGTVPSKKLSPAISRSIQNSGMTVKYVAKDPRTYEEDILNAFAFGGLPDAFLMSQDLLFTYEDKLITIPFTYFPERTYDESFVRSAEIFKKGTDGFLGFPLFADPLIMYYNQDLLETAGYAKPPVYWSDLFEYVPRLTKINEALKIETAGVALGEFENVKHAKDIFAALMLQLDNPIVTRGPDGRFTSTLYGTSSVSRSPAAQSLDFYGGFSDPVKSIYSWNKSMPSSDVAFISGDLAIYFGFMSEFDAIKAKNPNLNFDIAPLPQVKELPTAVTYADIYALSIPKVSPRAQMALSIASSLSSGTAAAGIAGASGFAPVRRDLVSVANAGRYNSIFYRASLQSRSWIDPDDAATDQIFSGMFEDILSGLSTPDKSIKDAHTELKSLLLR